MRFIYDKYGYRAIFNETTGQSIRFEKERNDRLWKKSGPELLDVSITNYCERNCNFCYRGSNTNGKNMSLELYGSIIAEAKTAGIFQIALGGGNPNQHPDFIDFLRIARENRIIPSYTTNGQGITETILQATKKYAGAVAISWYEPYEDVISIINEFYNLRMTINIHYVLDNDNIREAKDLLKHKILEKVNALIFLNYKPVGAKKRNILRKSEELSTFLNILMNFNRCKIGFDSCMISHLTSCKEKINPESIDYCEAARYSAFISEDGNMYPCSFMCGTQVEGYSLLNNNLIDIWQNSRTFIRTRDSLFNQKVNCKNCKSFTFCHGGCPYFPINCLE